MPQPHLRAADADRAAVAETLGAHMSAGRLTVDEYDERLARAYAAKTYGELDELTADLPPVRPSTPPDLPPARPAAGPGPWAAAGHAPSQGGWHGAAPAAWHGRAPAGWHGSDLGEAWRAWLRTGLLVLAIWAAISLANWELLYFWPVWVIGPWGAILLLQTVSARATGDGTSAPDRRSG